MHGRQLWLTNARVPKAYDVLKTALNVCLLPYIRQRLKVTSTATLNTQSLCHRLMQNYRWRKREKGMCDVRCLKG